MENFVNLWQKKLRPFLQVWRYFDNPWAITLLRLGIFRQPFFPYRIRGRSGLDCTMLARPGTASMADLFVLREVFIEETYADVLPLLPSGPVTVLDVGANLGSFCVWLAARHGIARGTCFEPDPSSFRLCRFNLHLNGCAQIEPIPAALGGTARTITMRVNTERPGGNSIYSSSPGNGETSEVQVLSLGDWLRQHPEPVTLLKLDCEGAEWEMLDETAPDLWRQFQIVVAEVHSDPRQKHLPDDFPRLLEARGFQTKRWDGGHMGLYLGVRKNS